MPVPTSTTLRGACRWAAVLVVLAVAWLATPNPVPLYDGIGFPDEPYRFTLPKPGAAPATNATTRLKVAGGSNTGGIIANSAEVGPQVSIYAPPHGFAVAGSADIVLTAKPVVPDPPLPEGKVDSNVYDLSFVSAGGPVTLVAAAQPPAITMRGVTIVPSVPVMEYRPDASSPWQELKTRRVGQDIFNANAPGAGQYALVQTEQAEAAAKSSSRTSLYVVIGATVLLMAAVLVGVRVMSRRSAAAS
jgi:hypothetical protein